MRHSAGCTIQDAKLPTLYHKSACLPNNLRGYKLVFLNQYVLVALRRSRRTPTAESLT